MDQQTTKTTQEKSRPTGGERFINPFTDYGFKRIFGTELSKDLLIEFLNSLLPEVHIEDLTFCNVEQFAQIENLRKADDGYAGLFQADEPEGVVSCRPVTVGSGLALPDEACICGLFPGFCIGQGLSGEIPVECGSDGQG